MTDRRPGPQRIDVHAHYLAPAYKEALQQAEMWLIGGIPVPEWTSELALEFMDALIWPGFLGVTKRDPAAPVLRAFGRVGEVFELAKRRVPVAARRGTR